MSIRNAVASVLGALLVAVAVLRPIAHGVEARGTLLFFLFLALYVVAPGVLLVRALGIGARDRFVLLGLGSAVGVVLECTVFLASRWWEAPAAFVAYPLPFLLLARRRPAAPEPGEPAHAGPVGLAAAALVLATLWLAPLTSVVRLESPLTPDMLFHTANAAEVQHRWPPLDPRVAGEPLNYHLLGYGLPAGAAAWTGLPVGDVTMGLLPLVLVALLVANLIGLGRVATGSTAAAVAGAAFFLLYRDPARWLGLPSLATNNHLPTGLYGSPTTALGFVLLAALGTLLGLWMSGRVGWPALVATAVIAFGASGAKGSVLPPALAGLALLVVVRAGARDRAETRRALPALLVVALAGAPLTLRLAFGPESYRAMFRSDAFATVGAAPLVETVRTAAFGAGEGPFWAAAPLTLLWLLAALGVPLLAAAALLVCPHRLGGIGAWLVGTSAAGVALALGLSTVDQSQLFFAYTGQLTLAILAGAGLRAAWMRRPALAAGLLLLCLPALAASARAAGRGLRDDLEAARFRPAPLSRRFAEDLGWLRHQTPTDAVLLSTDRSMLLSALGERRAYYETGHFTSRGHALRAEGVTEPFPDRRRAGAAFFARPSAQTLDGVLRLLPVDSEVLVVVDAVQFRFDAGFMRSRVEPVPPAPALPTAEFETLLATEAMHVYRRRR